jgi:hypothetical protein
MGHNLGKQVGQASNQATEARPGQRRRRSSDGQIPGSVPPGRGQDDSRVTADEGDDTDPVSQPRAGHCQHLQTIHCARSTLTCGSADVSVLSG